MKHNQTQKVMVPIDGQGHININLENVPNIEWNLLISAALPGIQEFYADPANRLAFEKYQAKI